MSASVSRPLALPALASLLLALGARGEDQSPYAETWIEAYGAVETSLRVETDPWLAEQSGAVGENTALAVATTASLGAAATVRDAPEPFLASRAGAGFGDHLYFDHPRLTENAKGEFYLNFKLSGVFRIKENTNAAASVTVSLVPAGGELQVGYLTTGKVVVGDDAGKAEIRAPAKVSDFYPNIFHQGDGSFTAIGPRVDAAGGYFTLAVSGLPVQFRLPAMTINKLPRLDDASNRVDVELAVVASEDADADFGATFGYAAQNPVTPNPFDPALPATGWSFASSSGLPVLPAPVSVATATGTGEASVGADYGRIDEGALAAADEGGLPAPPPAGGAFPDGFLALPVTGLGTGQAVNLGLVLPTPVGPATRWWTWVPGEGWTSLPTLAVPGTGFLFVATADGLPEDLAPETGVVRLLGGPGVVEVVFADGFEEQVVVLGGGMPRPDLR